MLTLSEDLSLVPSDMTPSSGLCGYPHLFAFTPIPLSPILKNKTKL